MVDTHLTIFFSGLCGFFFVLEDFNHDGRLDLATANNNQGASLLLGNGDGTFQPKVDYAAGASTVDAKAGEGEGLLFKLDLEYGGVFRLINIPKDQVHPIVMIECPRLLFPFVRQIVANATRDGGFPPLYIDPIDFVALYQQKLAESGAAGADITKAN